MEQDLVPDLEQRAQGKVKVALLLVNASQQLTGEALSKVRPDIIQFHGTETPEWLARVKQLVPAQIWKAIGLRDADTLDRTQKYRGIADRILFDAPAAAMPGGTGTRFDWSLLANHRHSMDWGIAGGLTPDNVTDAVQRVRPAAVDVSSGVEAAKGIKDAALIAAFISGVRHADL